MLEMMNKFAERVATLKGYTLKTAARKEIAKAILEAPESKSATVLVMSLRNLYGIDSLYWEPETIWLTLERDHGIDVSEESRNKLQAAISIIRNPAFFWDNLVFQRTVQALNGEVFDPESLQECHPAYMAWAVYEATLLRGMDPESDAVPELDEDVQQYAAVCLQRAGYVYPPQHLKPVSDNLATLLPGVNSDFISEVKKSWDRLDKEVLPERKFKEDPLGVQLAQLASCYLYVQERVRELATDVLMLDKEVIEI